MIICNMGDKSENPLITKVVLHAGTKSVTFTTGTRVRCCRLSCIGQEHDGGCGGVVSTRILLWQVASSNPAVVTNVFIWFSSVPPS